MNNDVQRFSAITLPLNWRTTVCHNWHRTALISFARFSTEDGDAKEFYRRRVVEIKHGRVSMLACTGISAWLDMYIVRRLSFQDSNIFQIRDAASSCKQSEDCVVLSCVFRFEWRKIWAWASQHVFLLNRKRWPWWRWWWWWWWWWCHIGCNSACMVWCHRPRIHCPGVLQISWLHLAFQWNQVRRHSQWSRSHN